MSNLGIFDIVGPRMVGPSSSHTAGAARLAFVASGIAGGEIDRVHFTLYGSFARTAKGHGTDRALLAGALGMRPDDERLKDSFAIAEREGIAFAFEYSDDDFLHPNTARMAFYKGETLLADITGVSIGGGAIRITSINGITVDISGDYPTLIVRHFDRHGVIAEVSRIFAERGLNIAFMRVFRQRRGDEAYMVIETDEDIGAELIGAIRALGKNVTEVYAV